MNPQMPIETQPEQQSNGVKAFAARSPFFFVLVFFVVSYCLTLVNFFVLPFGTDQVVQSALAIGVLVWLGWLRLAGFNGPTKWRSLSLLWPVAVASGAATTTGNAGRAVARIR